MALDVVVVISSPIFAEVPSRTAPTRHSWRRVRGAFGRGDQRPDDPEDGDEESDPEHPVVPFTERRQPEVDPARHVHDAQQDPEKSHRSRSLQMSAAIWFAKTGWWHVHSAPSQRRRRREVSTVRLPGLWGGVRSWPVGFGRFRGLCGRLSVLCLERGEAVHREAEAGDPFEQPLEVGGVDDLSGYLRDAVVGGDRHPFKCRGVAGSEFSFDDEAVAGGRHARPSMPDVVRDLGRVGPGSPG